MAPTDGLLGASDLSAFNQSVVQSDPYGIAGRSLASWTPDTSTWSPTTSGLAAFSKSFLSGLLGNYAQQNSADQLNSVIGVLPQLESNPMSVGAPEGVNTDAFAALKGNAVLKNYIQQNNDATTKKATLYDLLKTVVGEKFKNGEMVGPDAVNALTTDDPAAALNALSSDETGDSHISRLLDSYGITDPAARAGIRTPDEAKNYLLHVQGLDAAQAAKDAKIQAKKDSSDTQLENKLRAELEKTNSAYQQGITISPLLSSLQNLANSDTFTPADDLSLIDIGNKIVNPGGVLRANLVDQWKNAQNPYHFLAGQLDNVMNGGTFDDAGRQQIVKAITRLGTEKLNSAKQFADEKLQIGANKGLDTGNLIPPTYYNQLFGGLSNPVANAPSLPDPSTFIAQAKAAGLTKEQAKAQWIQMGGTP